MWRAVGCAACAPSEKTIVGRMVRAAEIESEWERVTKRERLGEGGRNRPRERWERERK